MSQACSHLTKCGFILHFYQKVLKSNISEMLQYFKTLLKCVALMGH